MQPPSSSSPSASLLTHLESLPKLVAHNVVQQRVDTGGHVVQDARDVGGDDKQLQDQRIRRLVVLVDAVDVHEPLGVERRPADEERHHNGHWKKTKNMAIRTRARLASKR